MVRGSNDTRTAEEASVPGQALGDYLLAQPLSWLVIVGSGSPRISVPASVLEELPGVSQVESLEECHAAVAQVAAPAALVYLDSAVRGSLQITLGKAVRLFPGRLVVCLESTEPDDPTFFSFGFRRLSLHAGDTDRAGTPGATATAQSVRLFEFSLSDYKLPPDWLNARYWANPERFDNDQYPDIHIQEYEEGDDDDED